MKKLLARPVRKLSIKFVIVLLIVTIFAFGYIFRTNILIAYHRFGEKSSEKAITELQTSTITELQTSNQGELLQQYRHMREEHRKALLELGFYEERTFKLKYLTFPEIRTMIEEYIKIHSRGIFRCWSEGKSITINDRPKFMPTWESLIKKYDVPPEEPNRPIISEEL